MWSGHIFISYAFKDEKRAQEICRLLEQRGVRCWIARRDARPGYNYGEEIIEAIDGAVALLVVISRQCNESEHVPREIQLALNSRKPVLPVRIESVEPSRQLGYYLSIKQWIDVSAPPTNVEIERLVAAIRTHLERNQETASPETDKQPTPLLAPTPTRPYLRPSLIVASTCAVVLLGIAAFLARTQHNAEEARRPPPGSTAALAPSAANTITVIEFVNHRADPSSDWYGKALQNAFDTELSKIPELSVKAPEIIERTARDTGVNPLVVARRLGVTRYIAGSFAVLGNTIHIDARIVETVNGIEEAAENVEGDSRDFFALQKRLALATLDHFRVRLTKAQEVTLQQNSRLD
jgi:TolB-like protein